MTIQNINQAVETLSGGQRRRAEWCRAHRVSFDCERCLNDLQTTKLNGIQTTRPSKVKCFPHDIQEMVRQYRKAYGMLTTSQWPTVTDK